MRLTTPFWPAFVRRRKPTRLLTSISTLPGILWNALAVSLLPIVIPARFITSLALPPTRLNKTNVLTRSSARLCPAILAMAAAIRAWSTQEAPRAAGTEAGRVMIPPKPVIKPEVKFFTVSQLIKASIRALAESYERSMRYSCASSSAELSGGIPSMAFSVTQLMSCNAFDSSPFFRVIGSPPAKKRILRIDWTYGSKARSVGQLT